MAEQQRTLMQVSQADLEPGDEIVNRLPEPFADIFAIRRAVPAEPTPEPGTAGTATVRGVEGVRVMRLYPNIQDGEGGYAWASADLIDGKYHERNGYDGTFVHTQGDVTDFAPDARVSTPAVTTPGTETPAETPAPAAFVLPDLYALTMAIANDSPLHLQPERREEFKAAAERVEVLLAEHAVTEDSLAEAVASVPDNYDSGPVGYARALLAQMVLLTGKAAS